MILRMHHQQCQSNGLLLHLGPDQIRLDLMHSGQPAARLLKCLLCLLKLSFFAKAIASMQLLLASPACATIVIASSIACSSMLLTPLQTFAQTAA